MLLVGVYHLLAALGKELDLCYSRLTGETMFCCVWCEMGQQQLPQQPVLPLLQSSVGHWGWLCNKSGAVLQFHGSCPWHVRYGELLSWGVCEETAEVVGELFSAVPTVPVHGRCGAVHLPVL